MVSSDKNLSNIELRHLRTFLTVADTENFTRAAERLGISQPSVSIQVKELEVALGTQLFHRMGPKVTLAPAGRAFRERAELVLVKFSDACQAVHATEALVAGHLSLGVIPPLNVPWMPDVLGQMAREHPGLAITVIENSADELEGMIENGRCDLGVGILSNSSPNLEYELLREDKLVLLCGAGGPFERRRKIKAKDLADTRLVVLPESYVLRQLTNQRFRTARIVPHVSLEVDTIDALLATVVASGLCTIMPGVVLEGRESLGLRAIGIEDFGAALELGIVWPRDTKAGAAATMFAELLRKSVRSRKQAAK